MTKMFSRGDGQKDPQYESGSTYVLPCLLDAGF